MKSLAARALAAGTITAGALMISVPVAGAATHGKGGSNGHGHSGAHGNHGNHGQAGHGHNSGGGAAQQSPSKHSSGSGSSSKHGGHHGGKGSGTGTKKGGHNTGKGSGHGAGGSAPPGNNGTIKVDQSPLSSGAGANHANHPHVTCSLALSFFGYDTGTDTANVQFSAQPPSGSFTPVPVVSGPTNFSFNVAKRTGGGQLDTSQAYTLDTSGLKAAHEGYHIRVTVHVTYSQGSDVKHKVFWYEPCQSTTSQSSSSSSSSTHKSTSGKKVTEKTKTKTEKKTVTSSSKQSVSVSSSKASSSNQSQFGLGSGPTGSKTELASSNSGQLPNGAGTDLGWFSPGSGSLPGDLGVAGGLSLLGAGSLIVRRIRRRRG